MNKNFETLLTIIAEANDGYQKIYPAISTTVGILEQPAQASNAVTIDNIQLKQKLMFIILDAHPDIVGIGTGKAGSEDVNFISQQSLTALSSSLVIEYMHQHIAN